MQPVSRPGGMILKAIKALEAPKGVKERSNSNANLNLAQVQTACSRMWLVQRIKLASVLRSADVMTGQGLPRGSELAFSGNTR